MPKLLRKIKRTVDKTIPDKKELTHENHPRLDYIMLVIRNFLVGIAAVLFVLSFFFDDIYHILKAIAYFCGTGAYIFECLLLTDCFKTKVPHKEMFMVYCLGPLYLLMGLGYIFK